MSKELDAKWREVLREYRTYWSPGMLVRDGDRYTEESRYPRSVRVPDWNDPATLGALLAQVRKRYMDPTIYARPDDGGWTLFNALGPVDPRGCRRSGPDEASAMLCGLELAP